MGEQKLRYLRAGKVLWEMHPNPKHFKMCRTVSFITRIGWAKRAVVSSRNTRKGIWLYLYKNAQCEPRQTQTQLQECLLGSLQGTGCGAPKDGDEKIQLPLQGECLIHTLYHSPAQV